MSQEGPSYSDQESALILKRAAELQARQGRALSLDELQAAATEAGIDATLVRQAAGELARVSPPSPPPAPARGGFLGAPLRNTHERVVEGELDPSAWEEVSSEIRRHLGSVGNLESVGRELVWANDHGRKLRVSVVPRRGRSLIRVEERLGELGGGLFLGMGLPLAAAGLGFILPICIAVLEMPALIPVALVAWFGLAFGFARLIYTNIARQRDQQLQALADGLAELCGQITRALPPAATED